MKIYISGKITGTTDYMERFERAEHELTKLQYQELQNVRNRGGRIINTGTKWHAEDVFSLIDHIDICDCYQTGRNPVIYRWFESNWSL